MSTTPSSPFTATPTSPEAPMPQPHDSPTGDNGASPDLGECDPIEAAASASPGGAPSAAREAGTGVSPRLSTAAGTGGLSGRFEVDAPALSMQHGSAGWISTGSGQPYEIRVDVDGEAPLQAISGVVWRDAGFGGGYRHTFIGDLDYVRATWWSGQQWWVYRCDNADLFWVDSIMLAITWDRVIVLFTQGGRTSGLLSLDRTSAYFRDVTVELDYEQGVTYATEYDTSDNPTPSAFTDQVLDIESTFARAGIGVDVRAGGALVPSAEAQANADDAWSNLELHDSMLRNWDDASRPPGWRMWVLAARQHELGYGLMGIMFDAYDSPDGPQRQGAAVFESSVAHETGPWAIQPRTEAEARRNRFHTLIHEMGHAFNLAHSFEKSGGVPWRPMGDRYYADSWMNYPDQVPGFWDTFTFNFDAPELRFLRHAPDDFVQMGGSPWAMDHGHRAGLPELDLRLYGRFDGYEYLEPVRVAARLQNLGPDPIVVPKLVGTDLHTVEVTIEGPDGVQRLRPYTHMFARTGGQVLQPNESLDFEVFIGGMPNAGSAFAEPGTYRVQVALVEGPRLLAATDPMPLVVHEPNSFATWRLRKEVTSERVTRVFRFEGSHYLEGANRTLGELQAVLGDGSDTARHVALALGNPHARARRYAAGEAIDAVPADVAAAEAGYRRFLATDDAGRALAAASQNGIYYTSVLSRFVTMLGEDGRGAEAQATMNNLRTSLARASAGGPVDLAAIDALLGKYTADSAP